MSRIEDTLREMLRERVGGAPPSAGIADRAIAGARRVRRSRAAFASLAGALCVAVVGFGVASFVNGPAPAPIGPGPSGEGTIGTPTGTPANALPVDLLIEDRLLLAGGGEIGLAEIGVASCDSCWINGAWRVSDGFLVSVYSSAAAGDTSTLWHVPGAGAPAVVVVGDGRLMVSPGTGELPGIRVAWLDDGVLWLGRYSDRSVTDMVSTPAPEVEVVPVGDLGDTRPLYPQAVVGGAVILAGTYTGGGLEFWDAWFPARGDYVPSDAPSLFMYGRTADGERIIGDYLRYPGTASKEQCLGEIDPDGFGAVRSLCPTPFSADRHIYPSRDGRWWMVAVGVDGIALYDADEVWSGAGPARSWAEPADAIGGAWLDDTSFVRMTRSSAFILHTDGRPDDLVPLALPGDATQSAIVVVDLR